MECCFSKNENKRVSPLDHLVEVQHTVSCLFFCYTTHSIYTFNKISISKIINKLDYYPQKHLLAPFHMM